MDIRGKGIECVFGGCSESAGGRGSGRGVGVGGRGGVGGAGGRRACAPLFGGTRGIGAAFLGGCCTGADNIPERYAKRHVGRPPASRAYSRLHICSDMTTMGPLARCGPATRTRTGARSQCTHAHTHARTHARTHDARRVACAPRVACPPRVGQSPPTRPPTRALLVGPEDRPLTQDAHMRRSESRRCVDPSHASPSHANHSHRMPACVDPSHADA